jgi:hypothetical protein
VSRSPAPAADRAALETADDSAAGRRVPGAARKVALLAVFAAVFLTFGVPRWFAGDAGRVDTRTAANFAKLCHSRGGTVTGPPASGTAASPQEYCTIRYGGEVYRMDAITPAGFDKDTADFQRQGCVEADREAEATAAGAKPDRTFVYHPATGVCEHRP